MINQTLADLPVFSRGYIDKLNVDGEMRRRLLDLGFSGGSSVIPLFKSPLGDPTAYFVMGSIIALRHEDADKIYITGGREEEI